MRPEELDRIASLAVKERKGGDFPFGGGEVTSWLGYLSHETTLLDLSELAVTTSSLSTEVLTVPLHGTFFIQVGLWQQKQEVCLKRAM